MGEGGGGAGGGPITGGGEGGGGEADLHDQGCNMEAWEVPMGWALAGGRVGGLSGKAGGGL